MPGQCPTTSPGRTAPLVHPHVRGERLTSCTHGSAYVGSPPRAWGHASMHSSAVTVVLGSPPRAWGRRIPAAGIDAGRRFTPTCVGTCVSAPARSCRQRGSPPRAWGTSVDPGAIAAYRPVHPHVRGDMRHRYVSQLVYRTGSPPRAWGQCRSGSHACADLYRFTPTCVGTACRVTIDRMPDSRFTPTCVGTCRDLDRADVVGRSGSPPRAWGQLES